MNKPAKFLSLALFVTMASSVSAANLQTAVGQTEMSARDCAEKAIAAFASLGVTNAKATENLENWEPAKSDKPSRSVSVFAGSEGASASVMCRPFQHDLVIFTSTAAPEARISVKHIWDKYYGLK